MQTHVGQGSVDVDGTLAAPLWLRRLVSSRAPLSGELSLTPWCSCSHGTSISGRGCCGCGHACSRGLRCSPCGRIRGHLVGQQELGTTWGREPATLQGRRCRARACRCTAARGARAARGAPATAARGARVTAAHACRCTTADSAAAPPHSCRSAARAHGFASATLCWQRAAVEVGQGGNSRAFCP